MAATPYERETVIVQNDEDETVRIWTMQKKVITAMRKKLSDEVREIASGTSDGFEWAEFLVDADRYDPARGIKRRLVLTDEQRKQRGEQLAAGRKAS